MSRYANITDRFSFSTTLFASGAVEFSYGATIPADFRLVGISIGNDVGSTSSVSQDLTSGLANSGTEGMLFESFTTASWDLTGRTLMITPNGSGGYLAVTTCSPAEHVAYGTGCYTYAGPDSSSLAELFVGTPAAKAALDGNALLFQLAGNGYVATWLPGVAGALYVPPTGAATILTLTDDSTTTFAPSVAPPTASGPVGTWTISSNGILTAGTPGNGGTDLSASLAEIGTHTGLGWYCWRDYNPNASGSGKVKTEEVGGVLYVTFDGVYEYGTSNPATFQWQINLTSGDVTMVFVSLAVSTNTTNKIVGCTLAAAGPAAVSSPLSTSTPFVLTPQVTLSPMTLSAAPAPVINPSTVVTYTANNLYEYIPSSGLYISTLFLSVNPNPAGFDLGVIGAPGCNAYILTLDLDLGGQLTFAPTASWSITYDNVNFAPGNAIAAQAISLITPNSLPNGQNAFGMTVSNAVLSTTQLQ
jgi:hypothetical protein